MKRTALLSGLLGLVATSQATILTFDISGISNFQNVNQAYGDNVTATSMGGFGYGVGSEGFTPDVTSTYGTGDPALWTTGYGDLTNVLFEDQDSTGILTLMFTAASGFDAVLYGFDLAAFSTAFNGDPVVQSLTVTDGGSNTFYSQTNFSVSETTHTFVDFSGNPIASGIIKITVDARNLGSLNDDIAIDNVVIGQQTSVPEPASMLVLAAGGAFLARRRKSKN